jgi:type III pantothenate kinase
VEQEEGGAPAAPAARAEAEDAQTPEEEAGGRGVSEFLAVTIGNSRVALARVEEGGTLAEVVRVPCPASAAPGAPALDDELVRVYADVAGPAAAIVAASVNPPVLERIRRLCQKTLHVAPVVAGIDFPIPLRLDVKEPQRVGADRLLGALAAYRKARGPCLTVDCGTACTINAVSEAGVFLGGAIFPGPDMIAQALADGTAQLPHVDPWVFERTVGRSTEEAILSGVGKGWVGAIMYLCAAMLSEVDRHSKVFLTGGRHEWLVSEMEHFLQVCEGPDSTAGSSQSVTAPNLVLEGLVLAYGERGKK